MGAKEKKEKQFRPRRDFKGLENRRMRAIKMFGSDKRQADIARELGVSRQSVSHWHQVWEKEGKDGLQMAGRAGRKPKLTSEQLKEAEKALLKGPGENGFPTELWTLPRMSTVIERITGVHFHPGHVWRIIRGIGWTLQRPARRARERKEKAILEWKTKVWPALKKKPAG